MLRTIVLRLQIGGVVAVRFGKWPEITGGIVLIGIGTAILIEHLGFMAKRSASASGAALARQLRGRQDQ